MTLTKNPAMKLPQLEGLRGVAALAVFCAHFLLTFNKELITTIQNTISRQHSFFASILNDAFDCFIGGQLAVYVFWFMSAYVISIKLFDDNCNQNNRYLHSASLKRYFRLAIPVFAVSVFCYLLHANGLMLNQQLAAAKKNDWLIQWYNIKPDFLKMLRINLLDVFMTGNSSYNMVLWTMKPEFMGSLLCFASFAIFGKVQHRCWWYAMILMGLAIGGILDTTYHFYFAFVAGLCWADFSNTKSEIAIRSWLRMLKSPFISIVVLVITVFIVPPMLNVTSLPAGCATFFRYPLRAIAITWLANDIRVIRGFLSLRPMVFLGRISFSVYLIHLPVLFSLGVYCYLHFPANTSAQWASFFISMITCTIFLAIVFERIIDRYSIRISNKLAEKLMPDK